MATDLVVRLTGQDNLSGTINNVRKSISDTANAGNNLSRIDERFKAITNSTAPLRKKIADIKKQMEKLVVTGDENTDTFKQMAEAAKRYQEQLDKVNAAVSRNNSNPVKGKGFDMKGAIGDISGKMGMGGIGSALGAVATPAGAAVAAVGAVGAVCVQAAKSAAEFETSLASMQALTGLAGDDLQDLGKQARDLAKTYGSTATEVMASMELIGSQAPELLKNKDALVAVTDAANILAKAGGLSVEDAAKAITTTMNQMGVSANEAMSIVNALGAGSQQGSAGIEYLNKAFEKAGTMARQAGMDYTSLTAAIETVAPKFSSADVAGSQLNSTLLKLSMGTDEFNPAVVGMSQALENLSNAQMTNEQKTKLVGEANITMLNALIEGKDTFNAYNDSLRDTTTAQDQAAIKMGTFEERVNRLKSSWDDFLIQLGQSSIIQGTMDVVAELGEDLMGIVDALMQVFDAFCAIGDQSVISPLEVIKTALKVITDIIKGICVAIEVVIRAIAKVQEWIKSVVVDYATKAWDNLKKSFSDTAWYKAVTRAFTAIRDFFKSCVDWIIDKWNKLCDVLGMENHKITLNTKVEQIKDDAPTNTNTTTNPQFNLPSGTPTATGKGGKKSSKATKEETPKDTIKWYEEQIAAEKKKISLLGPNATPEEYKAIQDRIKQYQDKINSEKLRLGMITDKEYLDTLKADVAKAFDDAQKAVKTPDEFGQTVSDVLSKVADKPVMIGVQIKQEAIGAVTKQINDIQKAYTDGLIDEATAKQEFKKLNDMLVALGQKPIEIKLKPAIEKSELSPELASKQQSIQNANSNVEQIKSLYSMKLIGKEEAKAQIDEINEQLKAIGQKPIELYVNSEGIQTAEEAMQTYAEKMNDVGSLAGTVGGAFSSLGQAIGGTAGQMLDFAGQSAQAVAQIIPQIVALMGAKEGEALASGTASAAALPFPANIAAIASIIATITALFASFAGSFADGGIIGGSSYHGDNLIARVNSGEMILNQRQQGNLFNALNSGGGVGGRDVHFTISGSNLKGCLKNYETKTSKYK